MRATTPLTRGLLRLALVLRVLASVLLAIVFFCVVVAILTLLSDRAAKASPLACESIRDADQRHYCRAVSRPQPSECELIKDHDLRQSCRARAR